jgi:hypothetical protein
MKQKFLVALFGVLILSIMALPTVFAGYVGHFWSFDMDNYAVYGDQNGYYYNFQDDGVKEVEGDIWADVKGSSTVPERIRVAAWRDTLGADTLVGSMYVQASATLNSKTHFILELGQEPADQYYLRFEKAALMDNGWDQRGEGVIRNTF